MKIFHYINGYVMLDFLSDNDLHTLITTIYSCWTMFLSKSTLYQFIHLNNTNMTWLQLQLSIWMLAFIDEMRLWNELIFLPCCRVLLPGGGVSVYHSGYERTAKTLFNLAIEVPNQLIVKYHLWFMLDQ